MKSFICIIVPFLLITWIGLSGNVLAQGLVDDTVERAALQALYDSTDGDQWSENVRWTQEQIDNYPNTTLPGVTITNGDVTKIVLGGANLTGTIPAELNTLTLLRILNLNNNFLSGTIPDLSNLQSLTTLDLGNNDLSGSFPVHISNLLKLDTLNLQNKFTQIQLTGPIPTEYAQLVNMTYLNLSQTNLSQQLSIPNSFSNLDNLKFLFLTSCGLTSNSISTGLSGLASIQRIILAGNPVTVNGQLPDILQDLPTLNILSLHRVSLKELPESFKNLQALTELDLGSNNLSSVSDLSGIVDTLSYLNSLRKLTLTNCQLVSLPSNFNNLHVLETLILDNNPNLSGSNWEIIGQTTNLQQIDFQNSNISTLPLSIANLNNLNILKLRGNNLYPIPEHIKNIPALQYLDLSDNEIATLPSWFGTSSMASITTLILSRNGLQNPLPASFQNFVNLVTLDLGYNNLTSPFPDLNPLISLQNLYVNNNQFTDTFPGYLNDLRRVRIQSNYFEAIGLFNAANTTELKVENNLLTFTDIIDQNISTFTYAPQDSIDTVRTIRAYVGNDVLLKAQIDTLTSSKYQWFMTKDNETDSAMTPAPVLSGYNFVIQNITSYYDGKQFYYLITNDNKPALTLRSRNISLEVRCDIFPDTVSFISKRYSCAMKFDPVFSIATPCKPASYNWTFGDGSSSTERDAWHAYANAGTYSVSLTLQYECGTCIGDTTITKSVNFSLPAELVRDSLISFETDVKQEVINSSASTFSDVWPLAFISDPGADKIGFQNGTIGVWRNDASFAYNSERVQSPDIVLKSDGTYELDHFNWQYAHFEGIPKWIKAGSITKYSPFSYELENLDVQGIYSAALYDYGGHLPSATGVNMRNEEMAFTGFEYLTDNVSGNWRFGNLAISRYSFFKIRSASGYMAVVEASKGELENVTKVDVFSNNFFHFFSGRRYGNYIKENEIICLEAHPDDPSLSVVVLRRAPSDNLWSGFLRVKNTTSPATQAIVDNMVAHSGKSSLKISGTVNYKQEIIKLDSGKTYLITAWASVNNPYLAQPVLAQDLGITLRFRNSAGQIVATENFFPEGSIIEGWQLIKDTFICPANDVQLEIDFSSGTAPVAWFDDLRMHPEEGNMKSYVYNLDDYRLQSIHDEENYSSFFYYDQEGNLYLTKKETERGIMTISENINYIKQRVK